MSSHRHLRLLVLAAALLAAAVFLPRVTPGNEMAAAESAPSGRLGIWFQQDPLSRHDVVLDGAALQRIAWTPDRPAFAGDRPGSLTARYDALAASGLFGFALPSPVDETTTFTTGAVFVIRSQGLLADPEGFFQISWGLWNQHSTGLERTGTLQDFAGDSFELAEFAWFPNVTAFGGPFLSPAVFGEASTTDPLFPFLGSFANLAFAAQETDLPLDTPLLAALQHLPDQDALIVSVHRIEKARGLLPVSGAVVVVPLETLPERAYTLDALGLTLWRDGFSGDPPSLQADVVFHALLFHPGALEYPGRLLRIPPADGSPVHPD